MADNAELPTGLKVATKDIGAPGSPLHLQKTLQVDVNGAPISPPTAEHMTQLLAKVGNVDSPAPGSDDDDAPALGWLRRLAKRITSLIALLPSSLGAKTANLSLSVTHATDDILYAGARNFASLSGQIDVGGTAENLIAAASGFLYVELHNPSTAAESLFFNDTGADCTNDPVADTELTPGGTYIWSAWGPVPVPTDAISINAATNGHAFRAKRV